MMCKPASALAFLSLLLAAATLTAQPTHLSHEVVKVHTGIVGETDLTGFTTYRVYLNFTHEDDFLSSLYANSLSPDQPFIFSPDREDLAIHTDCACYNHPSGGLLGNKTSSRVAQFLPELAYDSWWTINQTCTEDPGQVTIITSVVSTPPDETDSVCNWVIDDGGIFTFVREPNGWAGSSRRVLVAQITTCSEVIGLELCAQTFVEGNQHDTHYWCTSERYIISK